MKTAVKTWMRSFSIPGHSNPCLMIASPDLTDSDFDDTSPSTTRPSDIMFSQKRTQLSGSEPYSKAIGEQCCNETEVINLDYDPAIMPVSTTGWQGVRKTRFEEL
ncbi:hypothetical protein BT96DRAFT_994892 [Gymnopus androsaceus JB14]|uniref:Uncharacterized protein n=1 Tax=Gymnopus androsaceus JB14 TaxID=1447944 RepID=A0A6A4HLG4_9AGAR|nr:hypothetical protein BT96DRAFT_994892 [Gymnopus androsaceus JB14]